MGTTGRAVVLVVELKGVGLNRYRREKKQDLNALCWQTAQENARRPASVLP